MTQHYDTVRFLCGRFLWPGFLATLLVPITVSEPSLDVTVGFLLCPLMCPLSLRKALVSTALQGRQSHRIIGGT